ncbi:MAG: GNAT family N-acetyltransferase [Rikenellaceae bacterium]
MISSIFTVVVANSTHVGFAEQICDEMSSSAAKRGTGIAKRTSAYVSQKMIEGKAIIAFSEDGQWAGFTYIESWEGEHYVANSGLIINPKFREIGLAKVIKRKAFALSIKKFPGAILFGLTTGFAVMKINDQLGYHPVTFNYLTHDEKFWEGCKSCVNHNILVAKNRNNCLCTAMIFDSSKDPLKFDIDMVLEEDKFELPKKNK